MAALRPQHLLGDNLCELTLRAIDLFVNKMRQSYTTTDDMTLHCNEYLLGQFKETNNL
jgi:hypothetical protein